MIPLFSVGYPLCTLAWEPNATTGCFVFDWLDFLKIRVHCEQIIALNNFLLLYFMSNNLLSKAPFVVPRQRRHVMERPTTKVMHRFVFYGHCEMEHCK